MMGILGITNGTVITPGRILKNASVVVEGDRIIGVGSADSIRKAHKLDNEIDAHGGIVMPGLIDAHMHSFQVATKGLTCGKSLLSWLSHHIWPWEASVGRERARACAELSYLEMLRCGTTAFSDYTSVRHTDDVFAVAKEFGLRAFIGKTMMDVNSPKGLIEQTEESLKETERLIRKWHRTEKGRLNCMITPRFDLTCTDELFLGCKQLAKKYGVMIQTHAQENTAEVAYEKKHFGTAEIGHLAKLGLLGKNLLLSHCVWLSENDIRLLARTKTNVVHCPGSNMMLASGVAPLKKLLKHGINVGLGSDVGAYYNFSMFEQMRLACLLQKVHHLDPVAFDYHQAFAFATINGARCLNEPRIGSIEVGKKADIVLLDHNAPQLTPLNELLAQIVYGGMPSSVTDVIVDGKILMRNGKIKVFDERKVIERANEVLRIGK